MDEKWGIDFKKFRKNSSKKLVKGGLSFFLSPREEIKNDDTGNFQLSTKKPNNLNNESLIQESNSEVVDHSKDYIDDIPVIPSVDDFVDDDLTNQITKAPLIGVKQVANYKDLENDLLRHSAFATLEEVNLHALIKLLHSESCLDEPDIPWTKDGLFNEVVSLFNERNS